MSILLKNGTVFTDNDPAVKADVRVNGNKIVLVAPVIDAANDDQVIDMTGYTIYPGFISTHIHTVHGDTPFSNELFNEFLKNGVTTIRDMGMTTDGPADIPKAKIDALTSSDFPRILTCGKFICTPHSYGSVNPEGIHIGEVANSPEEAAQIVNHFADIGCQGIKTALDTGAALGMNCELPSDEFFEAIFKAAKKRGLWVSAHITSSTLLARFLKYGDFEIAHVPSDPMSDELIDEIKSRNLCVCTTLTVYEAVGRMSGQPLLDHASANTAKLYKAGVRLAAGNDMMADNGVFEHGIPIRELQLMKAAGMSVNDVIRSATSIAAQTCWIADQTGSIEAGKSADIIAIKGAADDNFECFRHMSLIINRGDIIVNEID